MDLDTKTTVLKEENGYAQIVIEPLEQGFGHTLGNALRRIMLSSLTGAAVTRIKIKGVAHEFSTIPGMKGDVVEFILNLKEVDFKMEQKKPMIVTISATGPKEITAADINCPTGIEVVNKDLYLTTLANKKSELNCEITVEYSRGYKLSEEESAVGVVTVDANFSPVKRVNYRVESTRIGRVTNLDKLIIEIWAKRSVVPLSVLNQAAAILVEQFEKIRGGEEVIKVIEDEKRVKKDSLKKPHEQKVYLEELGLPTRTVNSLRKGGIETVEGILAVGREGLGQIKNIGPKTIQMVLSKAEGYGK